MRRLNASSNALVAVAFICTLQNAISLKIDSIDNKSRWEILNKSTDKNELKISSMMCLKYINNIYEQFKNTKQLSNTKLHENNETTNDIVNLTVDIKKNVQKANHDILSVRKFVQNIAIRFRDTFKSVVSLSELECEPVNEELESIKKTVVDKSKPSVNSVIRAFGNRHHLSRVANQILKTSSDNEMFKDNYDTKQREAEKEFSTLWNILDNYIQSINRDALIAFTTFFEGMKAIKSVKQKINSFEKNKIYDKIEEADVTNLKNAVELAKALKLKFEDDWNLDSGELNFSQEQQKADKSPKDDKQSQVKNNIVAVNNDKPDTMEPEIQEIVQDSTNKNSDNKNNFPIEKTPLFSPITENKDQTDILQQEISNKVPSFTDNSSNVDDVHTLIEDTQSTSEKENIEQLTKPSEILVINKDKQNRKKRQILQWEELIKQANSLVSQESIECVNTLKATIADIDTINLLAKTSIQAIENHTDLKNTENNIIQQFNNKMIDTNRKLAYGLVNGAGDVCTKVTPINTEFVTKFENDQNIKRVQNLLGNKYDPNKYILKVLDEAKKMHGNGSIKKMLYNKMLMVTHNIKNETKEMDDAALYAMNKIHEGTLAESDLSKILNNEKTSKACFIRNMLLEKENEEDKKSKDKNEKKVQEYINENNVSFNSDDKHEDDYEYVDEQDNTVLLDPNVPQKNYVKETTKNNHMNNPNTNTKQKQPENMHSNTQRDEADINSIILRPKEIQSEEKTKTTNLDSDYSNITGTVNDVNELGNSITENVDLIDNIPENKNNEKEKVSNADAGKQTKIPETIDTQLGKIQSSQQELSDPMNNKLDEDTDQDNIVMPSPRNDKHDDIVIKPKKSNDYGESTHIIDDDSELNNSSTKNGILNDNISKDDKNDNKNMAENNIKEQKKIPEIIDTQIGNIQQSQQELSNSMNNKLDADTNHDNIDISSPRNDNHDGILKKPKKDNDYDKITNMNKDDNSFEHSSLVVGDNEKKITPINENDNQKKEYNKRDKHDPKFDNFSNDIEILKKIPNENIDSIESVKQQIIRNENNISAVSSYEPYLTSEEEDDYEPTDEHENTKLFDSGVSPNNYVNKSTTNNPLRKISKTNRKQRETNKTPDKTPGDQQDMDNITLHLKKVKKHKKDKKPDIEDSIINSSTIDNDNELENSFAENGILNDKISKFGINDKENMSKTDNKEQPKIPETIGKHIGNIQPTQQELSDPMNNKLDGDTDQENIVISSSRNDKNNGIMRKPNKGNDYGETTHIIDNDSEIKNSSTENDILNVNIPKNDNDDKGNMTENDTEELMKIPEAINTQIGKIQCSQQELSDPMSNKLDGDTDQDNIVMPSPRNDKHDHILSKPKKSNDYGEITHIINNDNKLNNSSTKNSILNDNISKDDNNDNKNMAENNIKEQKKIPEIIDTQIDNIQQSQQELSNSMNNKLDADTNHDNIDISSPRNDNHDGILKKLKKDNDYDKITNMNKDDNPFEHPSLVISDNEKNITPINENDSQKKEYNKKDTHDSNFDNFSNNIEILKKIPNENIDSIESVKQQIIRNENNISAVSSYEPYLTSEEEDGYEPTDEQENTKLFDTGVSPNIYVKKSTTNNPLRRISKKTPNQQQSKQNLGMNLGDQQDTSNITLHLKKVKNHDRNKKPEIGDSTLNLSMIVDDNELENSITENGILNDKISKVGVNDKKNVSETDNKKQPKIPETLDSHVGNIQSNQPELSDTMNNEHDGDTDQDNIVMSSPRIDKHHGIEKRPKKSNDYGETTHIIDDDSQLNNSFIENVILNDNISKDDNNEKENVKEADSKEQTKIPEIINTQTNDIQPSQQELSASMNNKLDGDTDQDNIMSIPRPIKRKRIVRRPKKGNDDAPDNTSMNANSLEEKSSGVDSAEQMIIPETIDTQIGKIPSIQQKLPDPMNNELDGDTDQDNIVMSIFRPNKRRRIVRRPKKENYILNDNISKDDNNEKENVKEANTKEQTKIPEIIDTQTNDIQPSQQELSAPMNNKLDGDTDQDNTVMSIPRPIKRKRIVRRPKKGNGDIFDMSKNENNDEEKSSVADTSEQMKIPETMEKRIGNTQITQQELSDPMNDDLDGGTGHDNIVMSISRPNKRKRIVRRPKIGNDNFYDTMRKNENRDEEKVPEIDIGEHTKIPAAMDTQINNIRLTQQEFFDPMDNVLANVDESNNKIESEPTGTSLHSKNVNDLKDNNKIIDNNNTYPVQDTENLNVVDDGDDEELEENLTGLYDQSMKKPKHRRRKRKITTTNTNKKTTTTEENPSHYAFNHNIDNVDEYNLPESTVEQSKDHSPRPKRTRRVRRIKQYSTDKKGDEKIPNEESESNKSISDDIDKGDGDFSSFLFKENNADQCKRYAYDSFKTVTIHDAKKIAFASIVNTSELNSNVLAAIGNAINNVKASMTFDDVDQSMRTVSHTLKTGLKQTISEVLTKVIPLAEYIMETAENVKVFYQKGPQSTYKMLTNVLESQPKISDLAESALSIISPGFDVDEMINNIFDMPHNSDTSLKQRRANAQRILIDLSIHMDTVMSNMDCFILFTMATIGNGASTLKSLKSRKVIMTDKHPRVKALRDTIGIIIKLSEYIRNGKIVKTVNSNGVKENGASNSDENPDRKLQKRKNVLTPKPNLNNSMTTSRSITVKRERTLGVIVVYPNRQIVYEKMANRPELDEFIEEETRKYVRKFGARDHPVFLKVSSKKEIAPLIEKVKKDNDYDGMSNIEIRNEITKMLNSNRVMS